MKTFTHAGIMHREVEKYLSERLTPHRLTFEGSSVYFTYFVGSIDAAIGNAKTRKEVRLGGGVYGEVFRVNNPLWRKGSPMNQYMALKKLTDQYAQDLSIASILTEFCIGAIFNESRTEIPNFACNYALIASEPIPDGATGTYNHKGIFMLMEYVEATSWLTVFPRAPKRNRLFLFQQVLLALAYAADRFKYNHNDLHSENILLLSTQGKPITYAVAIRGVEYTVTTDTIPVIVDQGLARLTFKDVDIGPFWMEHDEVTHYHSILWEPWQTRTTDVLLNYHNTPLIDSEHLAALTDDGGPLTPILAIEKIQQISPHRSFKIRPTYVHRPLSQNPIYDCKLRGIDLPIACVHELLRLQREESGTSRSASTILGERFGLSQFAQSAVENSVVSPFVQTFLVETIAAMVASDDDVLNELRKYNTSAVRNDFAYLRKEYTKMIDGDTFSLARSKYVFDSRMAELDELDALFHVTQMLPCIGRRLEPIHAFQTFWKAEKFDVLTTFRAIVESRSHLYQLLALNSIVPLDPGTQKPQQRFRASSSSQKK